MSNAVSKHYWKNYSGFEIFLFILRYCWLQKFKVSKHTVDKLRPRYANTITQRLNIFDVSGSSQSLNSLSLKWNFSSYKNELLLIQLRSWIEKIIIWTYHLFLHKSNQFFIDRVHETTSNITWNKVTVNFHTISHKNITTCRILNSSRSNKHKKWEKMLWIQRFWTREWIRKNSCFEKKNVYRRRERRSSTKATDVLRHANERWKEENVLKILLMNDVIVSWESYKRIMSIHLNGS